ncbi:hypothetical protein PBI_THONKO_48 [Mycobacterium phage Thonko]|uniref:Uncharacterized protein n=1 Tax=Mycobacterium phage Thonko TaxID=2282910 RepID=A0A346FC95_9CAUD|nr:hypothetical protein I5G57_gp048 [Mycobacterium phage Thonko]AXN53320.1 hypothetical protein PBI_THONKO_48 [Mycobacterium phage Thonko]
MADSPFNKKGGGTATASKTASKGSDMPDEVTNIGEDEPTKVPAPRKGDPFADNAGIADPSGVSGMKPIYFMGQLVLMHPTETGFMKTSSNTPENPQSEYVRFDIIPLTVPEEGSVTRSPVVVQGDEYAVLNKDGEVETCEPYQIGERIEDVLVFNKPLVREGKRALDRDIPWLIGRIELGQKKVGQSPPVILVQATDEDKAIYAEVRKALAAK